MTFMRGDRAEVASVAQSSVSMPERLELAVQRRALHADEVRGARDVAAEALSCASR